MTASLRDARGDVNATGQHSWYTSTDTSDRVLESVRVSAGACYGRDMGVLLREDARGTSAELTLPRATSIVLPRPPLDLHCIFSSLPTYYSL